MVIEDNPNDVFLVREPFRAHGLEVDLSLALGTTDKT
jgi:hypothetical protein